MPEIPEIASRAKEMDKALPGKVIAGIETKQPKCLNLPPEELAARLTEAKIISVTHHGKWLMLLTTNGWILLNMGMGGEVLLRNRSHLPEKHRLIVDFTDGTCLTINFWWFGYFHYMETDRLQEHTMTAKLGPNVLDLSQSEFINLIKSQKGKLKAILLDQTKMAGIGNAYIHDILFLAKLHPLRPIASLSDDELQALYNGVHGGLEPALKKGGAFYEVSIYGEKGGFQMEDIIIGYREGQPCPVCKTPIQKIKTGGTSSFICPTCQPLEQ
jgi:formamidopyrimidine-DNA glycosylase